MNVRWYQLGCKGYLFTPCFVILLIELNKKRQTY